MQKGVESQSRLTNGLAGRNVSQQGPITKKEQNGATERHMTADEKESGWSPRPWTAPFLVALFLVGGAAVLTGPVAASLDLQNAKAAVPLRKPLSEVDESAIAPYRVVQRHTLDSIVIDALGTDQYLSWTLEDTSVGGNDPLRFCHLFVTYDTGGENLVPHVPDECRLGAGYQPAQAHENTEVSVPRLLKRGGQVPVRVCSFVKTAVFNRDEVSVVYTFFCNGEFTATRSGVRLLINDPRNRHSFFSKIEVSFPAANRVQNVQGAAKLFDRLMPILIKDHFPDFAASEAAARS